MPYNKEKYHSDPEYRQKILDKHKDYIKKKMTDPDYRKKFNEKRREYAEKWKELTGQNETYQCQFCNSLFSKKSIKRHINLDLHKRRILYYNEREPNNTRTIIKYEI